MRIITALVLGVVALAGGCNDVRDFAGTWRGPRVGDTPALRVGVASDAEATLEIDTIDKHGLSGTLTVDGLVDAADIASVEGAEADALAGITFAGSPLRVYLAFAAASDTGGDLLAVIAIFDGDRVEIRLLRGGPSPVYGVFALRTL
jgi:hypothetical protein